MRMSFVLIVSISTVHLLVSGASWPNALERCSDGDPNMEKCLLKFTQLALPKIAKGLPAIGLKSVDPLGSVSFSVSKRRGPVTLNISADNVTFSGPSDVQLKRVFYDRKTLSYGFEGLHNFIQLLGNYRLKGSVIGFPVDSTGTFEFEMRGGFANHTIKFAKNVRDASHGSVNFDLRTLKGMKVSLKDSRLGVQGSKALTRIINDNWNLISPVLWDPMEDVIHTVFSKALRPLTSKFSVDDFFPTATSRKSDVLSAPAPSERHSYLINY